MILATAVHTVGVNWASIAVIFGGFGTCVATLIYYQERRNSKTDKQNQVTQQEIADAVNHLSDVLMAKLETKETVARISERLARVEGIAYKDGNI